MDTLSLVIFILAFGGMVIIHEFGHFIVARWSKIEVEEFGIGLPTPGALTLWSGKGYLLLKSGKRIEIPFNFKFPLNWTSVVGEEAKIQVDQANDQLVLRSIEVVKIEERRRSADLSAGLDHIYVDSNGAVVPSPEDSNQNISRRIVQAGKPGGNLELTDVIAEVHPGTRFTLNWLPLGGFVRPKGENDPTIAGGLAAANPWKRLAVLFAGPAMNLITAVFIFCLIIGISGGIITYQPEGSANARVVITDVLSNSPAKQAGLQVGDVLVSGAGQPIRNSDDLHDLVVNNVDKPVAFVAERNGKRIELTITPGFNQAEGRPMIGIEYCGGCAFKPITSLSENITTSLRYTGNQIYALVTLPVKLIRGTIAPEQGRMVGLKGIYDIMKQSVANDVEASQAPAASTASSSPYNRPVQTLFLVAALSISLGVFNLFPFPALDGGRIIFVLPELIIRRRV
ncbi:MAG TPA: site-2 protease family protein, partial [Anaerolineales bacterium]|nr:site-2 protease family protein [Anaerolineales bacterium]